MCHSCCGRLHCWKYKTVGMLTPVAVQDQVNSAAKQVSFGPLPPLDLGSLAATAAHPSVERDDELPPLRFVATTATAAATATPAASARESDGSKAQRLQQLRQISPSKTRILIAPPQTARDANKKPPKGDHLRPTAAAPAAPAPPAPRKTPKRASRRKLVGHTTAFGAYDERDLELEREEQDNVALRRKQLETSACFNVLRDMANRPSSMRAVLRQVYAVLHEATYHPLAAVDDHLLLQQHKQQETSGGGRPRTAPPPEVLEGNEFFSLIRKTQQQIDEVLALQKEKETQLSLEVCCRSIWLSAAV